MRLSGVITAVSLSLVTGLVQAGPVDVSLRPEMRPNAQVLVQAPVQVAAAQTGLMQARQPMFGTLRPVVRPADLATNDGGNSAPAEIILASAKNPKFQSWIKGFRNRALNKGIQARVFDRAFRGVRYDPSIIKNDRNQSEFKKTIWHYLDNAVSPERIKMGKAQLRKRARILAAIEAKYGVEKEVVAAVWGMESEFGTRRGDINIIQALATLSYDGRRGVFFEKQLIAALKILQNGDTTPAKMKGSWAGAMGHTQFIPTSYLAFAVDFTGDGRRDIWADDPTDALASTAAYLARSGWVKGQPWGVEVKLPRGFKASMASRKIVKKPSEWAALGVKDMRGRPVKNYGGASILLPAGTKGIALMIFKNFKVIERYNAADAYVIGVGHLSDRLKGKPDFQGKWPRSERALTQKERMEIQRRLRKAGFYSDKVDGKFGPMTRASVRAYQQARGLKVDGFPGLVVLKSLRQR